MCRVYIVVTRVSPAVLPSLSIMKYACSLSSCMMLLYFSSGLDMSETSGLSLNDILSGSSCADDQCSNDLLVVYDCLQTSNCLSIDTSCQARFASSFHFWCACAWISRFFVLLMQDPYLGIEECACSKSTSVSGCLLTNEGGPIYRGDRHCPIDNGTACEIALQLRGVDSVRPPPPP